MLHTKFPRNRPAGSGEDFKGFSPYMGIAAILVSIIYKKNLVKNRSVVSEKSRFLNFHT